MKAASKRGIDNMTVSTALFAVIIGMAWIPICQAGEPGYAPAMQPLIYFDPGEPAFLPRRYRTRCSFDVTYGRYYCANRCGSDYQFYYCSRWSFGCCHIGVGYCDPAGLLRCRP
jgi:hypothetical protein